MYLFRIFYIFVISLSILGCASKGYPPHKKIDKNEFPLQLDKFPYSVHETIGRYRKESL